MAEITVEAVMDNLSSNIRLVSNRGFNRVCVSFYLHSNQMEDIPVVCEWNRERTEQIPTLFQLESFDYYNFDVMPVLFQAVIGNIFENISTIFNVIKAPIDFASYIMQKTYSVTTEINNWTDIELFDWNVSPNKTWYVRVHMAYVTLFNTEEDMLLNTSLIATGQVDLNTLEVILTYIEEGTRMEFYYQDVPFHFVLSSMLSVAQHVRYFCVKPFTDLGEIRHPIYNNSNIVLYRGEAELNLHTFTILGQELILATHLPEMESGDIVSFLSERRSTSINSQILSQTIEGTVGDDGTASLTNTIKVATYMELYRR